MSSISFDLILSMLCVILYRAKSGVTVGNSRTSKNLIKAFSTRYNLNELTNISFGSGFRCTARRIRWPEGNVGGGLWVAVHGIRGVRIVGVPGAPSTCSVIRRYTKIGGPLPHGATP